jgi:hypothetical protein
MRPIRSCWLPSSCAPGGRLGTYFVRDDETGTTCSFDYSDIVTEGCRTIRTGERHELLLRLDRRRVRRRYDTWMLPPTNSSAGRLRVRAFCAIDGCGERWQLIFGPRRDLADEPSS